MLNQLVMTGQYAKNAKIGAKSPRVCATQTLAKTNVDRKVLEDLDCFTTGR
jgi:hypothetical protein